VKIKTLWTKRKGVLIGLAIWMFLVASTVYAGPYLASSHGNTSYGVSRSSTSQYTKGNCAHCHEQHASIGGSEPDPSGGSPSAFALFYNNHTNQTDNFCFKCHDNTTSIAASPIKNRSYSYRAGGWNADALDDILEAFTTGGPTSILTAHNLDNIRTFITNKWNYTAGSNPCVACHSPHAVQGDPANSDSAKSAVTRGYPVSRPSQHSVNTNTWGLWGDGAGEKMKDYTLNYQAPYRYNSTTTYEPDGATAPPTADGFNLTDFVTFCTDCHNSTNTIYSTTRGRNLKKFDWTLEKHGKGNATDDAYTIDPDVKPPYLQTTRYVLACTDCHEPHGSPNVFLIRKEVNNSTVTVTNSAESGNDNSRPWRTLCFGCHIVGELNTHSAHIGKYLCSDCHDPDTSFYPVCIGCHYHGSTQVLLKAGYQPYYGGRLF